MKANPNACALCTAKVERVWDDVLECYSHVDTDNPGKLRMCATPWARETTPFWKSVSELAAMREHIPPERRALSGVRAVMAKDVKEKSDE